MTENEDKLSNQRKIYYERSRDVLFAMSKLNQQNRNFERKKYKQQVEDLNKKLEDLTQAVQMLKSPNSKMTQKNIKIFMNEIYSKPPKKNYMTNKADVYHIDDIWNLDILGLKDYGPENIKNYRYVLVIIDNFSKIGFTVPIKNKKAITIKDAVENILISSKRKLGLIVTDGRKEFYNTIFQGFLSKNDIKIYSRKSSYGAVFAEKFNCTIRDLLKKIVFEQGGAKWIDLLPIITKQFNNRIHSSTKLTPIQASLKKNECYVYNYLIDKQEKTKTKLQVNDLVRTADIKKTFSKRDTTNWSYKLYKITEIIKDTVPAYKIDKLKKI